MHAFRKCPMRLLGRIRLGPVQSANVAEAPGSSEQVWGSPSFPLPRREQAPPCVAGLPRGLKHPPAAAQAELPPEPGCMAVTETRPVSVVRMQAPKDRSRGRWKQDQLWPFIPGSLLLPRVCPIPLTSSPGLFGSHVHWFPRPFFGLLLLSCYFFSFIFTSPPPSPSPLSRYLETFPPSAPATSHLSLDILQSRFPKEGSGLPSSSLSAQPLGPPSATRRVSLGQVRAVAVVGQTACMAHFSAPQGCGGRRPLAWTMDVAGARSHV